MVASCATQVVEVRCGWLASSICLRFFSVCVSVMICYAAAWHLTKLPASSSISLMACCKLRTGWSSRDQSSLYQIVGEVDLAEETVQREMTVTLPVSNNLPWLGLLSANIPLAVGAYLFDQIFGSQVDSLSSAIYTLSGPLEGLEPRVQASLRCSVSAPDTTVDLIGFCCRLRGKYCLCQFDSIIISAPSTQRHKRIR